MNSGRGIPEYTPRGMSARSELSLLINRVECFMLPGRVSQIDYKAAYCRVEMRERGVAGNGPVTNTDTRPPDRSGRGITTDWLRWVTMTAGRDRDWNPPSLGENVFVFSPTGNLNSAIVLGSFNTVKFRPNCDKPTIRRKTWEKPIDKDFFDYPFWELDTKKDEEHEWVYLPKNATYRRELGKDCVEIHTKEYMLWRVGNTQMVLKDGSFTLTIADKLDAPKETTEIRATLSTVEIHTNREASIRINRSEVKPPGVLARVEMQVKGQTTFVIQQESIKASVKGDAGLTLAPGEATLETRVAKARLALKAGVTSLALDGVSMYFTPTAAVVGMKESELQILKTGITSASVGGIIAPQHQTAPIHTDPETPVPKGHIPLPPGRPYTPTPSPAPEPNVPKAIGPQSPLKRWELKESQGPYYPRTKKPKG